MSFGKKGSYQHKSVAQAFGIPKQAHIDGGTAIKTSGAPTPTPSSGAGMKSVGAPKFGFPTKGRTEPNLKQADPDSSKQDETYPFPGRQAGQARSATINNQKPALGNFVKAPVPAGAKGNLKSKSAPKGISKFFGNAIKHPGKIAAGFTKSSSAKAPPNAGFSAKKGAKSPAQDVREPHQTPRKIARSFGG